MQIKVKINDENEFMRKLRSTSKEVCPDEVSVETKLEKIVDGYAYLDVMLIAAEHEQGISGQQAASGSMRGGEKVKEEIEKIKNKIRRLKYMSVVTLLVGLASLVIAILVRAGMVLK